MSRLTCAALVLFVPALLAAQTEQRTIKGPDVGIYNLAGTIRAEPGIGDAVTVEIRRGGADASQLKIETGPVRGRETLRVVYPSDRITYRDERRYGITINVRDDGTFSDGNWRDGEGRRVRISSRTDGMDAYADLLVRVPRGQRVGLYLAVGHAEVANVDGQILLDVGSVDVDVTRSKGSLTVDAGSGRVRVSDFTGDAVVETGSGGLTLNGIKGASLRLDSGSGGVQATDVEVTQLNADVGSGGLRLHGIKAPRIAVETGSGGATIELLSDVEELSVETGSGGVTVRAPASLSAEVDIETGSGGFDSDFPITTTRFDRNDIQGRIGAGKGRIRIESGSGTVRLLKG